MNSPPIFNILMYSHDTYGLGHIRRSMAIANHLRGLNTNVLILTGSPIAGRFSFPGQVDFVRMPGMIKKTNDDYQSLSIRIDQDQALNIRTNIILATAQAFRPDLFIVDKEPHGLKREVLPTLEWLKNNCPQSKSILGLRDILDDAEVVCRDWLEKGVYQSLVDLYDEIWIYGEREIYDPVAEYRFPAEIHNRVFFTGYIPRAKAACQKRKKIRGQYSVMEGDLFILVTPGGGGDGAEMVDHFVDMHHYLPASLPVKSLIVTGPFMPRKRRETVQKKAKIFGIKSIPFHPRMEDLMDAADLVVSMGGYNTVCEILSHRVPALIIPRETPRREQLIRAKCLNRLNLIDYICWHEANPLLLKDKFLSLLAHRQTYSQNMAAFKLSGLEGIARRISSCKNAVWENEGLFGNAGGQESPQARPMSLITV
ncbi:MAG: glycosyltransferase [Desulforhopalus sp.]|nr:glycosyltransferase [Desulforhopalus sp.]